MLASPSTRNSSRERCLAIVRASEAKPRTLSLRDLRKAASQSDNALISYASSNLKMTSLAIASYRRTLPILVLLQLLNAFATFLSLKSITRNGSALVTVGTQALATTSMNPGNFTQNDSKPNRLFVPDSAWSYRSSG